MTTPAARARATLATALGIAFPSAVPLQGDRVWLTSRRDTVSTTAIEQYVARRAARVSDDRLLAETVALLGAEVARVRRTDPAQGATAALDRLLAVPGLDQSRTAEAQAMLQVALRAAAATSPEAAARLETPSQTSPLAVLERGRAISRAAHGAPPEIRAEGGPSPRSGFVGRLRRVLGVERRETRLRAEYDRYQLLVKAWGAGAWVQGELEGAAQAIRRRGGVLPEAPWQAGARYTAEGVAAATALTRVDPRAAQLRQQVAAQVGELERAVAELSHLAETKVASSGAATTEAAELEEKAQAEAAMRDRGAAERARVIRVEAVAAGRTAIRHTELATGYQQAAANAAHTLQGYRELLTETDAVIADPNRPHGHLAALADEAADRSTEYVAATARAMPVHDALETGVPTGPALLAPVGDINRILAENGLRQRLGGMAPRPIPAAEYRRLMSADGMIIPVGGAPGDDVNQVTQVRLRMKRRDLTEIVDRDYDLAEQMNGTFGTGGQGVSTAATQSTGTSAGADLQAFLTMTPPTSPIHAVGQVVAPRAGVSSGESFTASSGQIGHSQFGRVDDDRGESLLYQWTGEWEIQVRNSPTAPWSPAQTVAAGKQLTWVPSAYAVQPAAATVTLAQLGRAAEINPELPQHTVTRFNGLQSVSDRLVAAARDQFGALDRVAYDQLNIMVTRDPARLLHEYGKPGGLTRPISVAGRPAYQLTVELEPVWSTARLSGERSFDLWQEEIENEFSGISASETYGTSLTGSVGLGAGAVPGAPAASAARGVSRSGGQNVSRTTITPVAHRNQGPTQGVIVDFRVRAVLRKIGDRDAVPVVITDTCEARLRLPENELLRAGGPAAAAAVLRDPDGAPRLDQEGRLLLSGDPEPSATPQALPSWLGDGPGQLRGPGKAIAEKLTGVDELRRQALTNLQQLGLVPPLDRNFQPIADDPGKDDLRRAGQHANYNAVIQNLTPHRIRGGLNQACQGGIPITLVDQRTGRDPHYRHFRLAVTQDFGSVTGRGTTPTRNVIRLGIGSAATSRTSSRSKSLPLSAGLFGVNLSRNAIARSLSWSSGRRANRVTITESTEPLDVLEQRVRLTFGEQGQAQPLADVRGSVHLLYEGGLTRATAPAPAPAAGPKAPHPQAVRDAITVAVDARNPADQIIAAVDGFRADSSAVAQIHAALSPDSLVANPDWMNGDLEIPLVVAPHGLQAQQYKVVLRGTAVDQTVVAASGQITGNINLNMTDSSLTAGTATGGGAAIGSGTSPVSASAGRSAGTSESTGNNQTNAQEWQLIHLGTHYELLQRFQLQADIVDSRGGVVQTVPLDDAIAQRAIAERRAHALYAAGRMDLPLPFVADAAERYLNDRLPMDAQVATGFVRRYQVDKAGATTGLAAEHTGEQLVAKVLDNSGATRPSPTARVDETLRATEELVAQRRAVDLGASYDASVASAQIDSIAPVGRPGERVDLFELVRPQFEQIAPGVLADSRLLAPALRVNLDAFQGDFETMLGPRGFNATVEVPVAGQHNPDLYRVRITARYVGDYTVDGTPEIPKVDAVGLDGAFRFRGQNRSIGRSATYEAGIGGGADGISGGAGLKRERQTTAGSGELATTIDMSGHFDLAAVERRVVFTSEVVRVRDAGAAAMTSARWKLQRTTPAEQSIAATPRQLDANVTLLAPRALIREPGGRVTAPGQQFDHRSIRLPESAIVQTALPYPQGARPTDELYNALEAELARSEWLGAGGFAEAQGALGDQLGPVGLKASFAELTGPNGLQLMQMAARGNSQATVAVTVKARITGFELAEDAIGDAQTGSVSRLETSSRSSSTSSRLGPGSVNAGAEGGPVSLSASASRQVKEQTSAAHGTRLEATKFEEGEIVAVRVPVSYDVTIAKGKRHKQLPNAAEAQFVVKMLKHEYLDGLRQLETGAAAGSAAAAARLQLTAEQLRTPDIRASAYHEDAAGNQVYEPYRPLVDALAQAKRDGTTLVVAMAERDGQERIYVASSNGTLSGVGDGGFAAAFGGLDPRLALMAQGRVDLREVYDAAGPGENFSAKVSDELVRSGVPDSMLKGLDYSATARQLSPAATPSAVGSTRSSREQERGH
ncbi:hypothetical protein HPO96_12560 [Kribbella sandramycini]|uniref:Uncharacterized protein n=1 Tax=Kribbella sandramycini TaxID=60450 RepID=A0A7Y4P0F1_9ACTN|nr:hypothetical protein [Kribbella sandramycini]MBB6569081.1 hypothetical protein [Kribbella sandramycini]NOL41075.1 hypothetical protein [Kribbella sandramycini]